VLFLKIAIITLAFTNKATRFVNRIDGDFESKPYVAQEAATANCRVQEIKLTPRPWPNFLTRNACGSPKKIPMPPAIKPTTSADII
jgi:hypothetical protein